MSNSTSSVGSLASTSSSTTATLTTTSTLPLTSSTPTTPSTTSTPDVVTQTSTAPSQPPTTQIITSIITASPTNGGSATPSIIIITPTSASRDLTTSASTSSTSSTAGLVGNTGSGSNGSRGLSSGATIAIAVVIPIVAVAALGFFGLWWFRRRRQNKAERDERKQEMEDYNFNPNHDPTLPAVAAFSVSDDQSGYRGWGGTAKSNTKTSTAHSSGAGVASRSDGGGYAIGTPRSPGNTENSGEAMLAAAGGMGHSRKTTMDSETMGAYAALPTRQPSNKTGVVRGLSNASSTYSMAEQGRRSDEAPIPVNGEFYADYAQNGPYDPPYGYGNQEAVIRDNPARRNTRIERAPSLPNQGSSGIAQNF